MKTLAVGTIILLMFIGCSKNDRQVLQAPSPEPAVSLPFGPFFLPENHSLSTVSLNYVTGSPQETTVYFTMVGEVDWARNDRNQTRYHKMVFKDLEESAVYQFTVKCDDREIQSFSSIQTMPYGEDYQFRFAVASIDGDLDPDLRAHFIVLGSVQDSVSEGDFRAFYDRNRNVLSSTILLPLFSVNFANTNVDLAGPGNGVYFARYKNLCLILINREMENYDFITRYVSDNPEDQNVIVLSHTGKDALTDLSRRLALLNCSIYAFHPGPIPEQTGDNVTGVENCQIVEIIKKRTYALVVTNRN